MLTAILYGLLGGLFFSIPAGPVSVLIFKNTGLQGGRAGIATLSGMIAAELLYILLYFFGINNLFVSHHGYFSAIATCGALIIMGLGLKNLFGRRTHLQHSPARSTSRGAGLSRNFAAAFVITILNPAILIYLIGLVSVFLKACPLCTDNLHITTLLISAELGTAIWFSVLISITGELSHKFQIGFQKVAHVASSYILVALGLIILFKNIYEVLS